MGAWAGVQQRPLLRAAQAEAAPWGFPTVWGLAWAVLRLARVRSVVKGFVYRRLYPAAWQAMTLTFPEPGAVCLCFGFYKFQRLFFAASTFLCERKPDGSSLPCSV